MTPELVGKWLLVIFLALLGLVLIFALLNLICEDGR